MALKNKLSVIVPVYNEQRHLKSVVEHLMRSPLPVDPHSGQMLEREWLFIDDCSTDQSPQILKDCAERYPIRVITQGKNFGKGAAVRRGIAEASGNIIVIQDADFEYDPKDIVKLVEPILRDEADVVYGSRFKQGANQVHRTYHYFVNRLLTLLSNLFSGIYLTDMETCYKVFQADLIKSMNLTSNRFGIEVEMTANIAKIRTRIFEIPISYFPRNRLQGKKIGWKDGVAALYFIFKYNKLVSVDEAFHNLPEKYLNPTNYYQQKKINS